MEDTKRPDLWAIVLGLSPVRDGNEWCVRIGDNLVEGVAGFGKTPEAAIRAFESAMYQCGGHSRAND